MYQGVSYDTFSDMTNDIYNIFVNVDLVNKICDKMDILTQGKGSVQ